MSTFNTETNPDTTSNTHMDADTDTDDVSSVSPTDLTDGTFTLSDLSFEQVNYDPDQFTAGVHVSPDEIKDTWGHKFHNPDQVTEYRGPPKLKTKIKTTLDPYRAAESDRRPRRRFIGPTGSAKTTLAKDMACKLAENDPNWPFDASYPVFEITMSHVTSQAKLIGHPSMSNDGGDTEYILNSLPKALLISQLCPVVLVLDEVNRATVKDALYEVIDGRTQVRIDGLGGGLLIQGNPYNLIVVSTMNAGPGYKTEPLDFAEQRRLGPASFINYPGEMEKGPGDNYSNWDGEEAEKELIANLSPASQETAEHIFSAGQNIREMARKGEARIKPIPTASLIEWAQLAHDFYEDGVSDALYEAGTDIVNGMYDQTRTFTQQQDSPLETVKTSKITDVKSVDYKPALETTSDDTAVDSDTQTENDAVAELQTLDGVGQRRAKNLIDAGFESVADVREAIKNGEDLSTLSGIGQRTADRIEADIAQSGDPDKSGGATSSGTGSRDGGGSDSGKVVCMKDCGFELDESTAEDRRDNPSIRPDDGNDYDQLRFGRCPGCKESIEFV